MIESISEGAGVVDFRRNGRRKDRPDITKVDRLPPHSPECETGILGCIMLSPNDCMGECLQKLTAGVESFYDLRHQTIYRMMLEMYDRRESIDTITLLQKLKDAQQLEQIGGISYISVLPDIVPSAANLSYYIGFVNDKYLLRKAIQTCTEVVGRIYDYEGDAQSMLDELERDILRIRPGHTRAIVPTKEIVQKVIAQFEEFCRLKRTVDGIPTGFIDLDKLTGGLHPGEMVVISALTSVGKTSLAMNIAEHAVLECGDPVGVFELEMTAEQLIMRMICSRSRVNIRNVREGFMTEREWPKITASAGKIANAAIWIDDSSDLSIYQLRAQARRMVQQYGIKLFIIDYLQLLNAVGGPRKLDTREQEVADISNGIKQLAKELRVPVIALSQLNDDGKLRESRRIGMDADGIWRLERNDLKSDGKIPCFESMKLWIDKNRNGPRGMSVDLTFLNTFTRFESASRVSDEDVPTGQLPGI